MVTAKTRAQECLAIQVVRLSNSQVKKRPGLRPDNADALVESILGFQGVSQVAQTTAKKADDTPLWVYTFQYTVGVKVTSKESDAEAENSELVEITAGFDAEYISTEELNSDDVGDFSKKNVGYHVWPYWREYVQSTVARMDLPSNLIRVPFYFAAMASEKE